MCTQGAITLSCTVALPVQWVLAYSDPAVDPVRVGLWGICSGCLLEELGS
jgi:hypothetical protein